MVQAEVRYPGTCPECGATGEWSGAQILPDGAQQLGWDAEFTCPTCGTGLAACGGQPPEGARELLLATGGAATLLLAPDTKPPAAMRVLRASLGLDLTSVRHVLEQIQHGEYVCTLPEAELLARRMREAGLEAVAQQVGHGA
ncbi:hypothetical protein ACIO3O_04390 [Streptomyces sp. NPDC087440]|uniref:hypothetical protein n=1 Tax=Streptomyces sp. NPDC087440 TaxID=3365790 RepID=UPI003815C648